MQNVSSADLRADIMDVLYEDNRNDGEYIGHNAMPILGKPRQSGTFAKVDIDNTIAAVGGGKVANGSKFQRAQRQVSSDSYATIKYGGEEPIPYEDLAELSNYFPVEVDAARALRASAMRTREVDQAAILFDDTTTFASYKTNGSDWTTAANGTPILDIRAAVTSLRDQVKGLGASRIVALCSATTLNNALSTDSVANALNYGGNGFASRDAAKASLAAATGLDGIFDSVIKNAAGTAIWADHKFGLYIVGQGDDLRSSVQVGRTFNWDLPTGSESAQTIEDFDGLMVQTYDETDCDSLIVRVKRYQQAKLLSARAGHILYGLNA
jgi:hypothetical protein